MPGALANFLASTLHRLGVLRRVWVLGARVDLQFRDHLACQLVLWQHAANRVEDQVFWLTILAIAIAFQTQSGIAGVPGVVTNVHFSSGHCDFFGIGDDYKVAAISVRGVLGAMLAHQNDGDVTRQSSEHLVAGVDNMPALFDLARLGHVGTLHGHGNDSAVNVRYTVIARSATNGLTTRVGGQLFPDRHGLRHCDRIREASSSDGFRFLLADAAFDDSPDGRF